MLFANFDDECPDLFPIFYPGVSDWINDKLPEYYALSGQNC